MSISLRACSTIFRVTSCHSPYSDQPLESQLSTQLCVPRHLHHFSLNSLTSVNTVIFAISTHTHLIYFSLDCYVASVTTSINSCSIFSSLSPFAGCLPLVHVLLVGCLRRGAVRQAGALPLLFLFCWILSLPYHWELTFQRTFPYACSASHSPWRLVSCTTDFCCAGFPPSLSFIHQLSGRLSHRHREIPYFLPSSFVAGTRPPSCLLHFTIHYIYTV